MLDTVAGTAGRATAAGARCSVATVAQRSRPGPHAVSGQLTGTFSVPTWDHNESVTAQRPSTTPEIAARMSRQARRDTAPEVALRKELHRRGMRFRVDRPIPGLPRRRADVVFTKARVAVFVDGCFWHSCPEHATQPASNAEWWRAKLTRNVERDRETDERLHAEGWTVLRFWEHASVVAAADLVETSWRATRSPDSKSGQPERL